MQLRTENAISVLEIGKNSCVHERQHKTTPLAPLRDYKTSLFHNKVARRQCIERRFQAWRGRRSLFFQFRPRFTVLILDLCDKNLYNGNTIDIL